MKRRSLIIVVLYFIFIFSVSTKAPAQVISIEDFVKQNSESESVAEKYSFQFNNFYSLIFGSKHVSIRKAFVSDDGIKTPAGADIFDCNGKVATLNNSDPLNITFIEGIDRYIRNMGYDLGNVSNIYNIDGSQVGSIPIKHAAASPKGSFYYPGFTRQESAPVSIYDSTGLKIFEIETPGWHFSEPVSENELLVLNSTSLALWNVIKKERIWIIGIGKPYFSLEFPYTLLFSRTADIIVYMNMSMLETYDFSGIKLWDYTGAFVGDPNMVGVRDSDGMVAISKVLPGGKSIEVDLYSRTGEKISNSTMNIGPELRFSGNWEMEIHFYPQAVVIRFGARKNHLDREYTYLTGFLAGDILNPSINVVHGFWGFLSGCGPEKNLVGIDPLTGTVKAYILP